MFQCMTTPARLWPSSTSDILTQRARSQAWPPLKGRTQQCIFHGTPPPKPLQADQAWRRQQQPGSLLRRPAGGAGTHLPSGPL